MPLAPLPVVLPLIIAAVLIALGSAVSRRILDLLSLLASGAVLAICVWLLFCSAHSPIVYWFGGWRPQDHFPLGISFVIDPFGAGMATLVALLVFVAFVFSWHYFESLRALYHAVMLVFLGAMCGLCLTGDLFNLFVWFELMSAAGVALCGYKAEEYGPLQGALNFAVTNTVGAFLSLTGVALLYAQTGALNMAEVGRALQQHAPGGWFVPVVFLFIVSGFLVKAAVFPFHCWLADAHAVAPTPVCVLFSGVMVELGLYATARIYWTIFAVPMAHQEGVRTAFLLAGALTAVIGGIACFGQRHLKRLLAFSTISHMGVMFLGFALLSPVALAGSALYVLGHGLVKSSLFICAGILLLHHQTVDEYELKSTGTCLPGIGILMTAGALGLVALPPFANFSGEALIEHAADKMRLSWVSVVCIVSGALTAGAVLRICGRIFLGWGQHQEATSQGSPHIPTHRETSQRPRTTPVVMWLPPLLLLLLAIGLGAYPPLRVAVQRYAFQFQQTGSYAAVVLDSAHMPQTRSTAIAASSSAWHNVVTLVLATTVASMALFPRSLRLTSSAVFGKLLKKGMKPLRAMQSGRIGDYMAWFALGIAVYTGILVVLS